MCKLTPFLLAVVALPTLAAADPQKQVDALQIALGVCQQQTSAAHAHEIEAVTQLVAQVRELQKRVQELEQKPPDGGKAK